MKLFPKLQSRDKHHDDASLDEESSLLSRAASIASGRHSRRGEKKQSKTNKKSERDKMHERQIEFAEEEQGEPVGRASSNFMANMQENIQEKIDEFKEEFEHVIVGSSHGPKRDLSYDQSNHMVVLWRMHGSVWPKVLPYCIANVIWTFLINYLNKHSIYDLTLHSGAAHTFMSTLVSFLVVSHSNIIYARFMESRQHFGDLCNACRDLVSMACDLTTYDQSDGAKKWRKDLAYQTILMLRVTVAVMNYQTTGESLQAGHEKFDDVVITHKNAFKMSNWFESERTVVDENFRAPTILAEKLRGCILKQRNNMYLQQKISNSEEIILLGNVKEFLTSFQGVKKLMTTPFPFPLVQMTRWFLFAWIFSIPMTLVESMRHIVETMVVVFFITYGFLGIEYVSMEMDDPFGDDDTDIDHAGLAEMVFEDIYLSMVRVDGQAQTLELRRRVREYAARGNALDAYRADICDAAFWKKEE